MDLTIRAEPIKLLEENTGVNLQDLGLGDEFLDMMLRTHMPKEKAYKWNFIKSKALMLQNTIRALSSVAQLVGHRPTKQNFTGLNLSQGTCLGCGFWPWLGHIREATN